MLQPPENFQKFYEEVKEIERRDSVLTPKQQIDRLNRPGSSYFNLNPFDVLQVDPDTPMPEIKKKYRQMSLLVHPDKNPGDRDKAQRAFEAANKAFKTLESEDSYKRCQEIVEEAKRKVAEAMDQKRKRRRKEGLGSEIEEDEPQAYRKAVYVQTCRLFADLEKLRQAEEQRVSHERKRKAEDEEVNKQEKEYQKEWQKNFEESRDERTQSWRSFTSGGTSSSSSVSSSNTNNSSVTSTNANNSSVTSSSANNSSVSSSTMASASINAGSKKKKIKKSKPALGFRPPKHRAEERPAS